MLKLIISALSVSTFLLACNSKPAETIKPTETQNKAINIADSNTVKPTAANTPTVSATWIDDFRAMRDAVYQKKTDVVSNYFNFPITNGSELLFLIAGSTKTASAFTKEDFVKNFNKIFDEDFVAALLKIKTEELYNKGTFTTEDITRNNTMFNMKASFNKQTNKLILNYYIETKNEGESSIMYEFDVKDNKIKYNKVDMAG
jgi:hypothetical protein